MTLSYKLMRQYWKIKMVNTFIIDIKMVTHYDKTHLLLLFENDLKGFRTELKVHCTTLKGKSEVLKKRYKAWHCFCTMKFEFKRFKSLNDINSNKTYVRTWYFSASILFSLHKMIVIWRLFKLWNFITQKVTKIRDSVL